MYSFSSVNKVKNLKNLQRNVTKFGLGNRLLLEVPLSFVGVLHGLHRGQIPPTDLDLALIDLLQFNQRQVLQWWKHRHLSGLSKTLILAMVDRVQSLADLKCLATSRFALGPDMSAILPQDQVFQWVNLGMVDFFDSSSLRFCVLVTFEFSAEALNVSTLLLLFSKPKSVNF